MTGWEGTRPVRAAAAVIAIAFCVHLVNGLYVERVLLGFETFTDYTDVEKLANAIGSVPWRASAVAHLVTAFAVLVLAAAQALRARATGHWSWPLVYGTGILAATGFALNGIAGNLGAQVLAMLVDGNVGLDADAVVAGFSIFVPVVNALAIVMLGVLIALMTTWGARQGHPRWRRVLGWVTAGSCVVMAFTYLPAYLLLVPAWALTLVFPPTAHTRR